MSYLNPFCFIFCYDIIALIINLLTLSIFYCPSSGNQTGFQLLSFIQLWKSSKIQSSIFPGSSLAYFWNLNSCKVASPPQHFGLFLFRIRLKAIRFGICRVVPPKGWSNPNQVDFESNKTFATKLQRMDLMQEGHSMGEGDEYNARQYEKMANEFRQSW